MNGNMIWCNFHNSILAPTQAEILVVTQPVALYHYHVSPTTSSSAVNSQSPGIYDPLLHFQHYTFLLQITHRICLCGISLLSSP